MARKAVYLLAVEEVGMVKATVDAAWDDATSMSLQIYICVSINKRCWTSSRIDDSRPVCQPKIKQGHTDASQRDTHVDFI